jgi:hypothetical protein
MSFETCEEELIRKQGANVHVDQFRSALPVRNVEKEEKVFRSRRGWSFRVFTEPSLKPLHR